MDSCFISFYTTSPYFKIIYFTNSLDNSVPDFEFLSATIKVKAFAELKNVQQSVKFDMLQLFKKKTYKICEISHLLQSQFNNIYPQKISYI